MPTSDVDIPFGRWATPAQRAAYVSEVVGRISGMAIASRHLHQGPAAFTVDDILNMPSDGLRYELFDGMLIVNPPPAPRHQLALSRLSRLLVADAPADVEVIPPAIGWKPSDGRWFEPDIVVVPRSDIDLDSMFLDHPPLLIVEVLSPATEAYDRSLKFAAYDEGGVGAYWIVDPSVHAPSIDVFERIESGGSLTSVGHAEGEERLEISMPWPLTVVPADLVR